jgi:hypothetical protein
MPSKYVRSTFTYKARTRGLYSKLIALVTGNNIRPEKPAQTFTSKFNLKDHGHFHIII